MKKKFLFDTDACIDLIRQKVPALQEKIRSLQGEQVAVSVITVAELEYGISKSMFPDRARLATINFLFPFEVLSFDASDAKIYGEIRAGLEKIGGPIGSMDYLIAAQALNRGFTLITGNIREFGRVSGLKIADWSAFELN